MAKSGQMRTTILLTPLCLALTASVYAYDVMEKYTPCLDYYTVGESRCQPKASTVVTPVQQAAPQALFQPPAQPQSPPQPQTAEQKVDQYLENYGKPPREFVEFYLNPTPENARKWVVTYNNMLKKGKDISDIWSRADALYQQGVVSGSAQTPLAPPQAQLTQSSPPAAQPAAEEEIRIGGLVAGSTESSRGPDAFQERVHVTYYFSKACPFCAKTTPELFSLFSSNPDKLALTCVDVTPVTADYRPDPSNIQGQLPCQWRLPTEGEVEKRAIRQTPTLLISQKQGDPLRLSGYVPLEQLRRYIFPEKGSSSF